ncbi:hypothetical protein BU23DRAFT_526261 [Bimuria novae-zelandiae CBS 107.79]|uniref:Helicase C-terminal domain-containing protein n=1 Tax=Bimuria novae-zelandiae CBS 107.79 TaxID=1447943 RepID=A0A6A5VM33_9PLEO|nr:hypothetical protein BU23DRAFT_526261 [Bimuria novae-zelandiae CBS 107.79]
MAPTTPAPTRSSARKRRRSASIDDSETGIEVGRAGTRFIAPNSHKRRSMESSTPRQPVATPRRIFEVSLTPESFHAVAAAPRVPTLTHDDPPPDDACFVCRRRGGSYAYTCKFEAGSDICTRCIKEKHKCREATDEEKTALDARCPQCKQRGYANCRYPDGATWKKGGCGNGPESCTTCVREKRKLCGAPAKRMDKSITQAFRQSSSASKQPPQQSLLPSIATMSSGPRKSKRIASSESDQVEQPSTPSGSTRRNSTTNTQQADPRIEESSKYARRKLGNRSRSDTLPEFPTIPPARKSASHRTARQKLTPQTDDDTVMLGNTPETANGGQLPPAYHPEETSLHVSRESSTYGDAADRRLIAEAENSLLSPPPTEEETEGAVSVGTRSPDIEMMDATDAKPVTSFNDSDQGIKASSLSAPTSRLRRSTANYTANYVPLPLDVSDEESADDISSYEMSDEDEEPESDEKIPLELLSAEDDDELEPEPDEEALPEPVKKPRRKPATKSGTNSARKGIDYTLPPMHDNETIYTDLTSRAVKLGLADALKILDRPINVATMCSGTESPLFGLMASAKALKTVDEPSLEFKHLFSAEIEQFKQAFIERNFAPELLFRDIREFIPGDATTATTAYGAVKKIPGGVDILVAGFSCKNLSQQNNHQKSLKENGESGETWMAVYEYSRRFRPSVVLLENVKSKVETWNDLVSQWADIDYEAVWLYCDTKRYYLPQTRERMYMIAVDRRQNGKDASRVAGDWKQLIQQLERPCSSPYESFLDYSRLGYVNHSPLDSETPWELCKLRYDQIRSELRLGVKRPCTKWNENGTIQPFNFADHEWFRSRSSREWEAIEVAHLSAAAQEDVDSTFKMKIWDVSQNVDRFHDNEGLMPCITPKGQLFSTYRQRPLSGIELLALQGLPLDKILLGRESAADCQDLAGNAMSTTVIAASQLSAIICASQLFRKSSSTKGRRDTGKNSPPPDKQIVRRGKLISYTPDTPRPEELDMRGLARTASLSSRLCNHECGEMFCEAPVHICEGCGHTACASHAGNPKHVYFDTISRDSRVQSPCEFVSEWRPRLPSRVTFKNFSGFSFSKSFKAQTSCDSLTKAYAHRLAEAEIDYQPFYRGEFIRHQNSWKVQYKSTDAVLELCIGAKIQWLLYVHCSPELPGDSELRKLFRSPVARGQVNDSLLLPQWELFVPHSRDIPLRIRGSSETFASFRDNLGLLDFQSETVPATLHIRGNGEGAKDLGEDITGDYDLLPHCGTASQSLYKRKRSTEPPLYLFLNPDPLSRGNDSFHFSFDRSRKQPGEERQSIAHLPSTWRPWNPSDTKDYPINARFAGSWEHAAAGTVLLSSSSALLSASVLPKSAPLNISSESCTETTIVLEIEIPKPFPTKDLIDYLGVLEPVTSAPSFAEWQPLGPTAATECQCAPANPCLLWNVEKGVATAYEHPKEAATRERALKTRSPIFHIGSSTRDGKTRIEIGLNVASLAHRAVSTLIQTRQATQTEPVSVVWRLLTGQTNTTSGKLVKFRLRSNATNEPYAGRLKLKHELRGTQPRALEWMRAQESGRAFTLMEVEEAVHPKLGWRVEALAQTKAVIRGGVLADRPSFGKTVTTIALVQSEFENHKTNQSLIESNNSASTQLPKLLDTAATLIVCPSHIADQWKEEFQKFLTKDQYKLFNILVIRTFAELEQLEFEDFQKSRVIIVSWTVLADSEYIAQLADFSAMPEPATASVKGLPNSRAFAAWLDRAVSELPGQLTKQQNFNEDEFRKKTSELLSERLDQDEFDMTLPLQVRHGAQYVPFESLKATAQKEGKSARKNKMLRNISMPLLHFFRFNRIVVDEYHYLDVAQKDTKKATENLLSSVGIKKIAAHKRWVLSGTPRLGSFTDVDNIASYLGLQLGRYSDTNGAPSGRRKQEEQLQSEGHTKVERFLLSKECMSPQWHQARHEHAQDFLNAFVRQNEPSLEDLCCFESLRVDELDVAHHAVYLELSQLLISQRMALRRQKSQGSDRANRLNEILNGATTGEEALQRRALSYETQDGESDLNSLLRKRDQDHQEIVDEIKQLLHGFEAYRNKRFKGLRKVDKDGYEDINDTSLLDMYTHFRQDVSMDNWLGDDTATDEIRKALAHAEKYPARGLVRATEAADRIKEAKKLLSKLRTSSGYLTTRIRSERFMIGVQDLSNRMHDRPGKKVHCDAPGCQGLATISDMYLTSHCGHKTCGPCLASHNSEDCVVPSCNTVVLTMNLLKATHLGSNQKQVSGRSFGSKMDAIANLIKNIPHDDQALVFAPDAKTIEDIEKLLDYHRISNLTPNQKNPGKAIGEFKTNSKVKVLILDSTSETAAGVNLFNANHVIFAAPLLVKTQYEYDADMEQAIARCRRYGQKKAVHIYHFAALRTVDVDILEHRHKRRDGITDATWPMSLPSEPLDKREKTKLVKNKEGQVALVPVSWLVDTRKLEQMGVDKDAESFTSLINFSETFENEVEE